MTSFEVTEDRLLGGRVILRQPREGYRAGMDAVLLAAAVDGPPQGRFLEIGCGAGAALLCAAARFPHARFVGVEREPGMAALALENAALNGWSARIDIAAGDGLERQLDLGAPFDAAFCNPPFNAPGRAPSPLRAYAHVSPHGANAWVKAFADRLTGGGRLVMIHRADALPDLLAALEGRLGGVQAAPVHPRAGAPAHRVLVRATKGSRAPFKLHQGLTLHAGPQGAHTEVAAALLEGRSAFAWG